MAGQNTGGGRRALLVGVGAFFLAVAVGVISQSLLENITSLAFAFLLLLLIVLVGVIFDIIGVATTAAGETSLHARAARRVPGARQALNLVRNASQVASFCNDVVGDICGTLSGAVGAAIVFRLVRGGGGQELLASILMTAAVAALTIGGKAWGKTLAIHQAEEIVFQVGRLLAWGQRLTGRDGRAKNKKRGKR